MPQAANCSSKPSSTAPDETANHTDDKEEASEAPPVDESRLWATLAEASFACDGVTEGWDSDDEGQKLSGEDTYLKVQTEGNLHLTCDALSPTCTTEPQQPAFGLDMEVQVLSSFDRHYWHARRLNFNL